MENGRVDRGEPWDLTYANSTIIKVLHFQQQRLILADYVQKVFLGLFTGLR